MTMTIAVDASDRVVSINEVVRGLACGCRCIECSEALVARQGRQRMHHFCKRPLSTVLTLRL